MCVCVHTIFRDELRHVLLVPRFLFPKLRPIKREESENTAKLFATSAKTRRKQKGKVEFVSVPQATKADGGSVQFRHLKRTTNHIFRATANMLTGRNLSVTVAKPHNHYCYFASHLANMWTRLEPTAMTDRFWGFASCLLIWTFVLFEPETSLTFHIQAILTSATMVDCLVSSATEYRSPPTSGSARIMYGQ